MPDIHLQRCPCPRCHSLRTIQTDATWAIETLCCPECEHVWDHVQRSDADRVDLHGAKDARDSPARASAAASHSCLARRRRRRSLLGSPSIDSGGRSRDATTRQTFTSQSRTNAGRSEYALTHRPSFRARGGIMEDEWRCCQTGRW